MASTSRDNSSEKCSTLTSHTTRMELLQLKKLSEISDSLDGKMHLMKVFLPKARDILNTETSQYVKEKLLYIEVIANICHVEEAIEVIGKDIGLVKLIFDSFGRCTNNLRLQKTLFNLLSLITCKIQFDSVSEWTYHLTNSYKYFFGPNIMCILRQNTEDDIFIEILTFLEPLSELKTPDGTHVLERLFQTEELVFALLNQFNTFYIKIKHYYDKNYYYNLVKYYTVIDKWLTILIAITDLPSYECNSSDTNNLNRILIIDALKFIHIRFIQELRSNTYSTETYFRYEPNLDILTQSSPLYSKAMYQSIALFSNLSGCKYFPRNGRVMSEIAKKVSKLNFSVAQENQEPVEVRHGLRVMLEIIKYLDHVVSTRKWSLKDIAELLKVFWHKFGPIYWDPKRLYILESYYFRQN